MENDGNFTKKNVNMAAYGHGNDLKRIKQEILLGFIAVSKDKKTLEQLKLHSMTVLAGSYRILTIPF